MSNLLIADLLLHRNMQPLPQSMVNIQDECPSVSAHVRHPRGQSNATSDLFRRRCTSSRPSCQPTTLTFSFSVSLSLLSSLYTFQSLQLPAVGLSFSFHSIHLVSRTKRRVTASSRGRRFAIIAWTERFTPTSQSGESYKCSPRSSRRRSHLSRDHQAHPRDMCPC